MTNVSHTHNEINNLKKCLKKLSVVTTLKKNQNILIGECLVTLLSYRCNIIPFIILMVLFKNSISVRYIENCG